MKMEYLFPYFKNKYNKPVTGGRHVALDITGGRKVAFDIMCRQVTRRGRIQGVGVAKMVEGRGNSDLGFFPLGRLRRRRDGSALFHHG
jgi:hypothetical protein